MKLRKFTLTLALLALGFGTMPAFAYPAAQNTGVAGQIAGVAGSEAGYVSAQGAKVAAQGSGHVSAQVYAASSIPTNTAGEGTLTVEPQTVKSGSVITVKGTGFAPRAEGGFVALKLDDGKGADSKLPAQDSGLELSADQTTITVPTTGGDFSVQVNLPQFTTQGTHWIRLLGGNDGSARVSKVAGFEVNDAVEPTPEPAPSPQPTSEPTAEPSPQPTAQPVPEPTSEPSPAPTTQPTTAPEPTSAPQPTSEPSPAPSVSPTAAPTPAPSSSPQPTAAPTTSPQKCQASATAHLVYPAGQTKDATTGPRYNYGDKLILAGSGWCHPTQGGSKIAVKLDEGGYSHRAGETVAPNATIWAIFEADANGNFQVEIPLPTAGETKGGTSPAFKTGAHSLRLLSGSLKAGDKGRTLLVKPFTVGDYTPSGVPAPISPSEDLNAANSGSMQASLTTAAINVKLPQAKVGSWVYLSTYLPDGSRRIPWQGQWYQVGLDHGVSLERPADLPGGKVTLVAQNPTGTVIGWSSLQLPAKIKIISPAHHGVAQTGTALTGQRAVTQRTVTQLNPFTASFSRANTTRLGGVSARRGYAAVSLRPAARALANTQAKALKPMPAVMPNSVARDLKALAKSPTQGFKVAAKGKEITVSVPASIETGQWLFMYLYDPATPVGWVQVDDTHQIKLEIAGLSGGNYALAAIGEDGKQLGWSSFVLAGGAPAAAEAAPAQNVSQVVVLKRAKKAGWLSPDDVWLLAAAGVILASSATVALLLRRKA